MPFVPWIALAASAQDLDADGVLDLDDDCPSVANPAQGLELGAPLALPSVSRSGISDVRVGDLDGDGDDDVAATVDGSYGDNGIGAWIREPTVSFVGTAYRVAGAAWSMGSLTLGDLDDDGDLDVLVDQEATWIENLGDGTFGAQSSLAWVNDIDIQSAVPVDIDGDGDLDIATAGVVVYYGYSYYGAALFVEIAENLGGGTFGPREEVAWLDGNADATLVPADVDGDGDPDLVLSDAASGIVRVLLSDGPLSFRLVGLTTASRATAVAPADLDGDGDLDLVVASCDDGRVSWVELDAGSRVDEHLLAVVPCPLDADAVDLDDDGDPEILVAGDGGTSWFENLGAGAFGAENLASTDPDSAVAAGDLDRTATVDLVHGPQQADGIGWLPAVQPPNQDRDALCDADDPCPLDVICVDADGDRLSDEHELSIGTDPADADTDGDGLDDYTEVVGGTNPQLEDTDGDGRPDSADPCPVGDDADADDTCDPFDVCPEDADPAQTDGDEDGVGDACDDCIGFYDPAQGTVFSPGVLLDDSASTVAADLDGDGVLDLVLADLDDGLRWSRGLGDGTFDAALAVGPGDQVEPADFDADGDLDLLATSSRDREVGWIENQGGGAFGAMVVAASGIRSPMGAHAADTDGDGDLDLFVIDNRESRVLAFEALGGGAYGPPSVLFSGSAGLDDVWTVDTADLDDDGDVDLVTGGRYAEALRVYENQGGAFSLRQAISAVWGPAASEAADIDGDGDLDLVVAGIFDDLLVSCENLGGLSFGACGAVRSLDGASAVQAADLDADGDLDLVCSSQFSDELLWLENTGAGAFVDHPVAENTGAVVVTVALADLDGNGALDLLGAGYPGTRWYRNLAAPDQDADGICDADDPDPDGDEPDPDPEPEPGDPSEEDGVPPDASAEGGCGCAGGGGASVGWTVALVALVARRRFGPRRVTDRSIRTQGG